MTKYPSNEYTWGYEIEWGDVDRRLTPPENLGKWEYAETDIVNIHEPFKYIACDPLGTEPYMGGEINTKPTSTWNQQVDRIMEIHKFFTDAGNMPSASCVNHGHLHVFVPGLKNDIDALKSLLIPTPNGNQIPLNEVAEVTFKTSPSQISREGAQRRIVIEANVRGRDVESVVLDIQKKLDAKLKLPEGYFIT